MENQETSESIDALDEKTEEENENGADAEVNEGTEAKFEVEGASEETEVEEKTENKDETDTEKTEAEDESKTADEKTEEQSEGKIEDTESETSDEKTEDAESETSDEKTEEKSDEETDEVKDEKSNEESEDEKSEESKEDKVEESKDEKSEDETSNDEKSEDEKSEESKDETSNDEKSEDEKSEESKDEASEDKDETSKDDEKSEESKDEKSKDDEKSEESKDEESKDKESKDDDAKDTEDEKSDKSKDEKSEEDKTEDKDKKSEKEDKEDKSEKDESEEKKDTDESKEEEKTEDEEGDSDKEENESDDVVEIKETGVIYIRTSVPVKMNKDSSYLFYNLEALEDIGPFADFDFSEVKDASYMFAGTKADLSKTVTWNPEKLEKAEGIFDTELTPGWYQEWLAKKEIKEEEKEEKEVELVKKEEEDEDVDVNTSLVPADRVGTEELQALLDNSTVSDPEMDDEINAIAEIMKQDPENEALRQIAAIESGITGDVMNEVKEALDDDKTAVPEEIAEAAKNAEIATEEDVEENKKLLKKAEKGGNVNIAGEDAESSEIDLDTLKEQAKETSSFEGELTEEDLKKAEEEEKEANEEENEREEIELVEKPQEEIELVEKPQEEIELVQEEEAKAEPEEVELVNASEEPEKQEEKKEENVELVGGNVDLSEGSFQETSLVDKVLDVFSTDVEAATPKPTLDPDGNSPDEGQEPRQSATSIDYKARDTMAKSQAYVSHLYVTRVLSGAAPFDDETNTSGLDADATNKVIRSYDDAVYALTYATALTKNNIYNTVNGAKMYVRMELTGFNPNQVKFDTNAMTWMQDKRLYYKLKGETKYYYCKNSHVTSSLNKVDGMLLIGYRVLPVSEGKQPYCIPGTGVLNCVINVKDIESNKKIRPKFSVWLETLTNREERKSSQNTSTNKVMITAPDPKNIEQKDMIRSADAPELTTTAGVFFKFTYITDSTFHRTYDVHSTRNPSSVIKNSGFEYLNGSGKMVRGHGRVKQTVWNVKLAKPDGHAAGSGKGCTSLIPGKKVTIKVGITQDNSGDGTESYKAVGLMGLRTYDVVDANGKASYVIKKADDLTKDKKINEVTMKSIVAHQAGILAMSPSAKQYTGQGKYVANSLSVASSIYSFDIMPGTNINPGDTLTSGEFMLFSEQPANSGEDAEGEAASDGDDEANFVVVCRTQSITGYALGNTNATTRTFGKTCYDAIENSIEAGGGYHAHLWLTKGTNDDDGSDTGGGNISGSSYYSTSGIAAYGTSFNLKHYQYITYEKKDIDADRWKIEHARKLWLMWDNRYFDLDVNTDGTLKYVDFAGILGTWEASTKSNWNKLGQGKKLKNTQMVFVTKKDGSEWKDDNEMYQVNLLPDAEKNSMTFYTGEYDNNSDLSFWKTYKQAAEHGAVCGVVVENFDYTPIPDIRNYLGIVIRMKFKKNATGVIGKSCGFTHTIIQFHHHKGCDHTDYKPDKEGNILPYDLRLDGNKTVETLGSSDGVSLFRMRQWANHAFNCLSSGKPGKGTQVFWVDGGDHRMTNDSTKVKIVRDNLVPPRKYRPTQYNKNGTMKKLNTLNHPHAGTSLYVIGDENTIETNSIAKNSMSQILKMANLSDQLDALNNKAPTTTKELAEAGRATFSINPGWGSSKTTAALEAYMFIPTARLTTGKTAEREVVSQEALYASKKNKDGDATSKPIKLQAGQTYQLRDFGANNGEFEVIHEPNEIHKYLELDKYCGNVFENRTFYILSGTNALTAYDNGTVKLAPKVNKNEDQQWKVVKHNIGGYKLVNVGTNRMLNNSRVDPDSPKYHDPQIMKTNANSSSEDGFFAAFNITGTLNAATITSVLGNHVMTTSGSYPALSKSASTTWKFELATGGNTTGFVVHFSGLKAGQSMPLFFTEYVLDKEKLDPTKTLQQTAYIIEGSPEIDVSTGTHTSKATVQFVDVRAGVLKETVDKNRVNTLRLKQNKEQITYTLTFYNMFDDSRFMKLKCAPPKNNDANGTSVPPATQIAIVQNSLKLTSSLGDDEVSKYDVSIDPNDGAIYVKGVMEASEMVKLTYNIKVWGMQDTDEGYIRNNCTLILDRMIDAKGNVVAAVDANGTSMGGADGLRINSNRVETFFSNQDIITDGGDPDIPVDPDIPIDVDITPDTITTPPVISPAEIVKEVNRQSNNFGEDQTWTLTAKIPFRSNYPTAYDYEYQNHYDSEGHYLGRTLVDSWRIDADLGEMTITDEIDPQLDYRAGLEITYQGSDISSYCTIRTPARDFAGGQIEIAIDHPTILAQMESNLGVVIIKYNTRINKTAPPHTKIPNQAHLTYRIDQWVPRHTTTSSSGGDWSNKVNVWTGETEVYKYNTLSHKYLIGAVISVYTADGHIVRRRGEYPVNYGDAGYDSLTDDYLQTTDEDGLAYFYGLKDGSYYFREVTPPIGYEWNKTNSDTTSILWGRKQSRVEIYNNPYQGTTVEKSIDKNEWLTNELHTWTVTGHIPQYFTDEEYAKCEYQFIDIIDYEETDIQKKRLDYRGNVKVFVAGTQMTAGTHYKIDTETAYDGKVGYYRVIKLTMTMLPAGITAISDAAKGNGWKTNTVVMQYDTVINERAHEHEIIPNRVELNYCGFGVRRYAKSDLRIVPSEDPLDRWDWNEPEEPGYPHEFGEPGGHLTKKEPDVAEEKDEWIIDDPYVYTPYRELKINCIIDQKYDPYEEISFIYDIDGYPCYDKQKKLHWTVVINPTKDGEDIEASVFDSCQTPLKRYLAKFGDDILIYLPPGTYTVNQRKPMRYNLVESKPEVTNAEKVPGSYAISNNLINYRDAEDTFVNVLSQWNMHSSAFLQKNEPGLREKLRGYLNIVLINGQKDVMVTNQETGETVYSGTRANVHCVKIDYGRYSIYVGGRLRETVDLQQYSMQRRYAIS